MIRNMRTIGCSAALLALLALHAPADAAQVNVPASTFHRQMGGPDVIMYSGNLSTNFSASTITMIAPIPRVPGFGAVTVFVDGYGVTGTYNCTVSSSVVSKSFARSSLVTWSQSVNFSAAEMPSSSYLTVTCTVPSDGAFKGITVTG